MARLAYKDVNDIVTLNLHRHIWVSVVYSMNSLYYT